VRIGFGNKTYRNLEFLYQDVFVGRCVRGGVLGGVYVCVMFGCQLACVCVSTTDEDECARFHPVCSALGMCTRTPGDTPVPQGSVTMATTLPPPQMRRLRPC
jgi:hypothetical protein